MRGGTMAKRVTVSIPDMLHEKMEKWRNSFNLSKMFQEAVSEAIQKKEDFQRRIKEDLDMAEIIERLRKEKARSDRNSFEAGCDAGLQWAKSAGYDDIQYALNWNYDENVCQDPVLGDYFAGRIERNKLMEINDSGLNEYLRLYLDGWLKGLSDFWTEVKDKI